MHLHRFFMLLFGASELLLFVAKRSKSATTKNRDDRRSLLLFWIIIPVCFVVGETISENSIGFPVNESIFSNIGTIVFIVGFIIRWFSIFQLGKMFTVDVSITSDHILKTDGLYKVVRHPSYLGLILIVIG